MDDEQLELLYTRLLENYFQKQRYKLAANFYQTKTLNHTIEVSLNRIQIRISATLRSAPMRILEILGILLLAKAFKYNVDNKLKTTYKQYVNEHLLPNIQMRRNRPSEKYTPIGVYFNLDTIFDELNEMYFNNKLEKPLIGWSLKPSYTRLGFYSSDKNLLVISRIFDSRKVPEDVVRFLMYHEMLHILIPVEIKNGRRKIHPAEFREMEHAYPSYKDVENWIVKRRKKL